jgi:hypothetical protein
VFFDVGNVSFWGALSRERKLGLLRERERERERERKKERESVFFGVGNVSRFWVHCREKESLEF